MGLFSSKPAQQPASNDDATKQATVVFDDAYRDELRQIGREHVKDMIQTSAGSLAQDMQAAVEQLKREMKDYLTRQLDVTIASVNSQVSAQLDERLKEFSRAGVEAQEQASQSFNRNAQVMHEKYQQLSATLQQTISSQEVMMITVFDDNKNRIKQVQAEQDKLLQSLNQSAQAANQHAGQLSQSLEKNISDQSRVLGSIYNENLARLNATKEAQDTALETLKQSTQALRQQHQQLSELIDNSVAQQKAMMIETVNENMARIIEHYLIGALGEQTELKAQLPAILERLEENKQAMTDDMAL